MGQLRAAGFVDVRISAGQPYPRGTASRTRIGQRIADEEPELANSLEAFADSVRGVIIEGRRRGSPGGLDARASVPDGGGADARAWRDAHARSGGRPLGASGGPAPQIA